MNIEQEATGVHTHDLEDVRHRFNRSNLTHDADSRHLDIGGL
jgi:hypothetical protein